MKNCPNCNYDFEEKEEMDFPYGNDIECPKCKEILRTDWECNDISDEWWWIIEIKDYKWQLKNLKEAIKKYLVPIGNDFKKSLQVSVHKV